MPKEKMAREWSMHNSYKQILQKSARKDMNDLFSKRKEFLEKNFQGLPGIVKDVAKSRESMYHQDLKNSTDI